MTSTTENAELYSNIPILRPPTKHPYVTRMSPVIEMTNALAMNPWAARYKMTFLSDRTGERCSNISKIIICQLHWRRLAAVYVCSVLCTMPSRSVSGKIGDLFLIPTPLPTSGKPCVGRLSLDQTLHLDRYTDRLRTFGRSLYVCGWREHSSNVTSSWSSPYTLATL